MTDTILGIAAFMATLSLVSLMAYFFVKEIQSIERLKETRKKLEKNLVKSLSNPPPLSKWFLQSLRNTKEENKTLH